MLHNGIGMHNTAKIIRTVNKLCVVAAMSYNQVCGEVDF